MGSDFYGNDVGINWDTHQEISHKEFDALKIGLASNPNLRQRLTSTSTNLEEARAVPNVVYFRARAYVDRKESKPCGNCSDRSYTRSRPVKDRMARLRHVLVNIWKEEAK